MEKHYEASNILFLESGAHSKSLQIYIALFTIDMLELPNLVRSWIYGKSHSR